MTRINIDISKGELDYIREAIVNKHNNLLLQLATCELEANPKPTLSEVSAWADKAFETEYVKKPHWTQTAKGKKILARRRKKK